jgi:hypothetical protein
MLQHGPKLGLSHVKPPHAGPHVPFVVAVEDPVQLPEAQFPEPQKSDPLPQKPWTLQHDPKLDPVHVAYPFDGPQSPLVETGMVETCATQTEDFSHRLVQSWLRYVFNLRKMSNVMP